jgi:hypothetical protein
MEEQKTKFEQIAEEQQTAETQEAVEEQPVEEPESSTPPTEEAPQKESGVQKRIDQMTKQKYDAKKRERDLLDQNNKLLELLKAQKPQKTEVPKEEPKEPQEDDFDTNDQYVKALIKFNTEKQIVTVRKTIEQEFAEKQKAAKQTTRQQQLQNAVDETIKKGFEKFKDKPEEFEDAINEVILPPQNDPRYSLVVESPNSHDIIMHFRKNEEAAIKYSGMSNIEAAKHIGKLEAGFSNKPQKSVSKAPDPISPVGNEVVNIKNYKDGKITQSDAKKEVAKYFNRR